MRDSSRFCLLLVVLSYSEAEGESRDSEAVFTLLGQTG